MATQSGGVIFSFEDITQFYNIISFIEQLDGVRIIYRTMRKDDRLYITSEKEMTNGRDRQ